MTDPAPRPLSTIQLAWLFFKIGSTAFGGLGASLAVIHRELVDRRGLLTAEQMTEALAFAKPLPGSTVVQVVSYVGHRLGGWSGSALATMAFLTPPMLAMLAVATREAERSSQTSKLVGPMRGLALLGVRPKSSSAAP